MKTNLKMKGIVDLRINRQIRAPKVRVIDSEGNQVGIVIISRALEMAEQEGLDLVEIAPTADPPVCKIIDYGKFRYQLTKKEKESKKSQHQSKLKEVKMKNHLGNDVHYSLISMPFYLIGQLSRLLLYTV